MTDIAEVTRLAEKATPELPDELRVPLHSLQADMKQMFGRVAADGSVAGMMADSVLNRLSQIETACYNLNASPAWFAMAKRCEELEKALKPLLSDKALAKVKGHIEAIEAMNDSPYLKNGMRILLDRELAARRVIKGGE